MIQDKIQFFDRQGTKIHIIKFFKGFNSIKSHMSHIS